MDSLAPTNFFFPTVNSILNGTAGLLLIWGWWAIKQDRRDLHKKVMLAAFGVSAAFLASYLYYHFHYASVRYQGSGWIRPVYFFILITHIILATANLPFILRAVFLALKGRYAEHARLARWVWPVWVYVSITGVLVYFMLYIWIDPSLQQPSLSIPDLIPRGN
jgi:putative membrane protein